MVSTVAYFVRKVSNFMKIAADEPRDDVLQARGRRWYALSLVLRTIPLAIGSIAMLIALTEA